MKWSTCRAHRVNMPTNGWLVDVEENSCGCSIHFKFGVCAHVVVARSVLGLGNGVGEKLVCRRARKNNVRGMQSIQQARLILQIGRIYLQVLDRVQYWDNLRSVYIVLGTRSRIG